MLEHEACALSGMRALCAATLCALLAAAVTAVAAVAAGVDDPPPLLPLLRADQANKELSIVVDGG